MAPCGARRRGLGAGPRGRVKFAFVLVFGSFTFGGPSERASPREPWFALDKAQHFVASAFIQGSTHGLLRATGLEYREASFAAAGVTATVGLGKELVDRRTKGQFSWRDLVADAAGAGAGAVIVRQLDAR